MGGRRVMDWIDLAQDMVECWAFVNAVIKLLVPKDGEILY
jgi:hypothetical protein